MSDNFCSTSQTTLLSAGSRRYQDTDCPWLHSQTQNDTYAGSWHAWPVPRTLGNIVVIDQVSYVADAGTRHEIC